MKTGIGKPVSGIATFGPEVHENPYPWYEKLRRDSPVHWDEKLGGWLVTRYEDAAHVLNDRHYSSSRVALARDRFRDARWKPLFDVLKAKMSEQDDPDHKRVRGLVNNAFARTAVEQWAPILEARAGGLLENATKANQLEFIADFAVPLPLLLILEIVGIPLEDRERVKTWCDDFAVVALNYFASISPEEMEKGLHSTCEFRSYLEERMVDLRNSKQNNLLSGLAQAEQQQHRLSVDELLSNLLLLLSAGNETTTCLLSNGMASLLAWPEQMQLLRDDPKLIPNAVEELLRFDSPVQFLGRVALQDVNLGGEKIRAGQLVLPMIGAANRDPEKFDHPNELDVTRQRNHHLSFGHGIHFCAGAQLARLEAKIAFETILRRFATIELVDEGPLKHRANFNIRCYERLTVRVS